MSDVAKLSGRTALVTGGSRGIGRAIALRLGEAGATVAVHYGENQAAAEDTVAEIATRGGAAFPVRARLGTPDGVDTLFTSLTDQLAERPLDIVVNNAGGGGNGGTIEQTTEQQLAELYAINVAAPFFILQRALPLMPDGGRIINISSCAPRLAAPQQVGYAMTKGSIDVLSRTLAVQLGPRGITVNSVAPGATDTDGTAFLREYPEARAGITAITALGRIGQPDDIADVVAFLASDDARWITGTVIDASGGTFLSPATGH